MRLIKYALLCVIMAQVALAEAPPRPIPKGTCDNALAACISLTNAQDQSIQHLKEYTQVLEKRVAKDEEEPLVPTWLIVVGGIVAGGVLGYSLHK